MNEERHTDDATGHMCHDAINKALAFPQHDKLDHYPERRCCQVTHMMEVKHPGEQEGSKNDARRTHMHGRAADNVGGDCLGDSSSFALLLPPPLQCQPTQQDCLYRQSRVLRLGYKL